MGYEPSRLIEEKQELGQTIHCMDVRLSYMEDLLEQKVLNSICSFLDHAGDFRWILGPRYLKNQKSRHCNGIN